MSTTIRENFSFVSRKKKCLFFQKNALLLFSSLHNYYANRAPTFIKSPSFNHAIRSIKVAFLFELISSHSNSNP